MRDFVRGMQLVTRAVAESAAMAVASIRSDKFRTFLSLLGVSIGIFTIVAVFCAVNALKSNLNEGLSTLGSDVVYVMRWPFTANDDDTGEQWWEYRLRPGVTEDDYDFISRNSATAASSCYYSEFHALARNGGNSFSDGYVLAATSGFDELVNITIEEGRYFSGMEGRSGQNVAVIGCDVASALFGCGADAVGSMMKINGSPTMVIGVIKKEGTSMVSIFNKDAGIIVPLRYGRTLHDISRAGGTIIASPKPGVSSDVFQGEIRQLMRSHRRLSPSQKNNFSINTMSFIVDGIGELTDKVEIIGWIIACFSLLIGGFGIANIMFVSVRERTAQIGIQKALGAPRYVILTQFLTEAAVLALSGGVAGVGVVFLICCCVNPEGFDISMSLWDAFRGLAISLVIGILSGMIPACSASAMDPVESMNA